MDREQKLHRAGFSLVELLIVIAIMGILVGGTALSVNLLRSADTKGAAYDINSGLTDMKSRTRAGKEQWYMYLFYQNDTYYMDLTTTAPDGYTKNTNAKEIGDSDIKVYYGNSKKLLSTAPEGFVCVAFRKKDGAFLVNGKCICPEKIYVEADNAPSYVVRMIEDTGHHYIGE